LYNEFVMTSSNFVRTCTSVYCDWLLEIAPQYYNLANFPNGEAKESLKRMVARDKAKKEKQRNK
jgi:pre-mRNA-splicing factor ATP-dependent RNA helicase DHX15/PRP43